MRITFIPAIRASHDYAHVNKIPLSETKKTLFTHARLKLIVLKSISSWKLMFGHACQGFSSFEELVFWVLCVRGLDADVRGWMQRKKEYTVYTAYSLCTVCTLCTQCIHSVYSVYSLYSVYEVYSVYIVCSACYVYSVYSAHSIYSTVNIVYAVVTLYFVYTV